MIKGDHHHQTVGWQGKLGISNVEMNEAIESTQQRENWIRAADHSRVSSQEDRLGDVAASREELVDACQQSVDLLAATAMPLIYEHEFPPILLTAWQLLVEGATSTTKNFPQLALGIPRGHAKTTLIKLFVLYCILYTNKKFILIICDNSTKAESIVADVCQMLDERNILSLFGDWKVGRDISRQDLKTFAFRGKRNILAAIGTGGSVRGLNIGHSRPDVMIFEDIQTKECSESQIQSVALERWMIGTAMKAKSPSGCSFIFVGNMYPGPNSILKKLKNNPTWMKFISGAILADGTALWPALHSVKDLIAELDNDLSMGHPEIFFSEVLNDTEAGINTQTDLSKLAPWNFTELDRPQGKFIMIDPSTNRGGGDATTIGSFEVYDGIPCLVELYEENLSPGNTIRKVLFMALKSNIRIIAIEATSYQYTFIYWFAEICKQLGITGIECVEVYSGSTSKNGRIIHTLRSLTSGEIILHPMVKGQVAHQIANWNPLKRDNDDGILDVLTYAPRVMELYGHAILTPDSLLVLEAEAPAVLEFNSCF